MTTQSLSVAIASGKNFYKNGTQYVILEEGNVNAVSVVEELVIPQNETGEFDDLTELKGVGPKTAESLNAVGIYSFSQIAALDANSQIALNTELNLIGKKVQKWVELAQEHIA